MPPTGFTHESPLNESVEWYTPPEIFKALNVTFDLDPCSPGEGKSFVPARKHYTVEDDGLNSPWDDSFVFVNPPYGKHTGLWMRKLSEHNNGIALVFARTDVKWFHDVAEKTSAILFVETRIKFYQGNIVNQGGTPGAGSMLLGFGLKAAEVLKNSGLGVIAQIVPSRKTEDKTIKLS